MKPRSTLALFSMLLTLKVLTVLSYNPYQGYHGYQGNQNSRYNTQSAFGQSTAPSQGFFGYDSFFKNPGFGNGNTFNQFPDNVGGINNNISPQSTDTNPNRCGIQVVGCPKTRYRSLDGTCNNLKYPGWGTPNSTYSRLLPPKYGDGISTPTDYNHNLPLPRILSVQLFPDVPIKDPIWTLAAMQYGQIITHDMSMIAGSTQSKAHMTQCCTDDGRIIERSRANYHCYATVIPVDDPVFKKTNIQCSNFVRTITDRDRNCVGGNQPAEQLTVVTAHLDASIVYGSSLEQNQQVRAYQGGRLRTEVKYGREFPPSAVNKTAACDVQSLEETCYLAGDVRVNQNPQLTIFQVLLLREHNRIADNLAQINPHWDDETIFQESRKIVIAEHQHISYYEWLPIFIGLENSYKHGIIYQSHDFINDYRDDVNPGVLNSHATAAFRFFHSAIAGYLELIPPNRYPTDSLRLSDWFNRPAIIEENNNFDDLTRGMATQPELNNDVFFDSEITQFLFRNGRQFGSDLRAADIQRNRDHGLASYNDHRELCHLPRAHTFEDFLDVIPKEYVEKLASLYKDPEDVDVTVGGSLETRVPGTLAGPTFLCILTEQFYRTRVGDRFFYENGNKNTGFTLAQLNEIRKSSISKLMCDNGDRITEMQPRGFEIISKANQLVPCEQLPTIDLTLWKDINSPNAHYSYFKK